MFSQAEGGFAGGHWISRRRTRRRLVFKRSSFSMISFSFYSAWACTTFLHMVLS
jgi:hypothetical protein